MARGATHRAVATELHRSYSMTAAVSLPEPLQTARGRLPRPLILVAEDDADCAQAVEVILSSAYDVSVLESGRDLLAEIEQEKPDLLVLDYQLPDMNGLRVMEAALRKQGRFTPAIAMSAYSNRRNACLKGGFRMFLHKPFGALDLIWAVELALRGPGKNLHS
jgi:CheY-like chemotaxis protein